jgi:hypothetical protein
VRFDRSAVDRLLLDADLPRWSAQRPGILVWVVAATATGEDFVAADDPSGPGAALQRRAWERGLPLSFPLLDLEDRVRARPSEIWGLDRAGLRDLSARYAPAAVLVGRLEPTGTGAWVGSWRLLDSGQSAEWVSRGLSADATAGAAMDAVADRLAARYALVGPAIAEGSIEIRVSGIRTVDDYARTLAYLQSLDQVSKLALHAARDDEVAFRMQVLGGSEGLRRVASFGGVLAADVAPQAEGALRFRLLP